MLEAIIDHRIKRISRRVKKVLENGDTKFVLEGGKAYKNESIMERLKAFMAWQSCIKIMKPSYAYTLYTEKERKAPPLIFMNKKSFSRRRDIEEKFQGKQC